MEYFLISATLNKAFLLSKNTELGKFLREYYQSIGVIFFKKEKLMIMQLLKENVGSVSQQDWLLDNT